MNNSFVQQRPFPYDAALGFVLCVIILLTGMASLRSNLNEALTSDEQAIKDRRALVLDKNLDSRTFAEFLVEKRFIADPHEAAVVAGHILRNMPENGFENLGSLMKNSVLMPVDTMLAIGTERMRVRAVEAQAALGFNADAKIASDTASSSSVVVESEGPQALIKVKVNIPDDMDRSPSGILVRLSKWSEVDNSAVSQPLAYAVTDNEGKASFLVPVDSSYSVVPLVPGLSFGGEKGTTNGHLEKDGLNLRPFKAKVHSIPVIDRSTYSRLRDSRALFVRTPRDFSLSLRKIGFVYVVGWLVVMVMLWTRRRNYCFKLILPLMALTAVQFLGLLGVQDPLLDIPLAYGSLKYFILGLASFALISWWNYPLSFSKPWRGRSLDFAAAVVAAVARCANLIISVIPVKRIRSFRFSGYVDKSDKTLEDAFGYGCLLMALILIIWVCLWGRSPGGSDALVNLVIPGLGQFQPSEICKFLFVGFMALFFSQQADKIAAARGGDALALRTRLRYGIGILLVIVLVLGVYVLRLKDMGPAMVILVTFILMYSIVRRDVLPMIAGTLLFGLFALTASWLGGTPMEYTVALLAWLLVWCVVVRKWKGELYESAIFMVIVVVAYTVGASILEPISESLATRLGNRVEMTWGGIWDNHVPGGDQIVQGLWGLATGGTGGLGLGSGNPSLVPAYNTDMILSSLSEMLGLQVYVLAGASFLVLVYLGFAIARKCLYFPRYLVLGITLVTLVQFLLISLGSLGLIPLSGVAVPLLSHGGVSLFVTLAAFGSVMSTSGWENNYSAVVRKINDAAEPDLRAVGGVALSGVALMLGCAVFYGTVAPSASVLVRPAYVLGSDGARMVLYNPRIQLLKRKLQAGNIYDSKGLLLATNSLDDLNANAEKIIREGGLSKEDLEIASRLPDRRIYPWGPDLLFALGDVNEPSLLYLDQSQPAGYMADIRHDDRLRGFDFRPRVVELESDRFRAGRFLPVHNLRRKDVVYDFDNQDFVAMLKLGTKNNPLLDRHNESRDDHSITLTLDAALQKSLNKALAEGFPAVLSSYGKNSYLRSAPYMRVSMALIDAGNGDLLASSQWPLPCVDTLAKYGMRYPAPHERIRNHKAITERDLATTYFSEPGSTAKVMSAIAGLMNARDPREAFSTSYRINPSERVHLGAEPAGETNMFRAIKESSNNYFLLSVNEQNLNSSLDSVYSTVGARITLKKGKAAQNYVPYIFNSGDSKSSKSFHDAMDEVGAGARKTFARYKAAADVKDRRDIIKSYPLMHAWGQGALTATPLAMARVAGIVGTGGVFASPRYLADEEGEAPKSVILPVAAHLLDSAMHAEAAKNYPANASLRVGGKTGTPERGVGTDRRWIRISGDPKAGINDAWYIMYMQAEKKEGNTSKPVTLALALRIERSHVGSGAAKKLVNDAVLPVLKKHGYTIAEK